jgi:hypothetical protein
MALGYSHPQLARSPRRVSVWLAGLGLSALIGTVVISLLHPTAYYDVHANAQQLARFKTLGVRASGLESCASPYDRLIRSAPSSSGGPGGPPIEPVFDAASRSCSVATNGRVTLASVFGLAGVALLAVALWWRRRLPPLQSRLKSLNGDQSLADES